MKRLASEEKKIQDKIREVVNSHRAIKHEAMIFWQADMLLLDAADRIDELEERVAIMSEDQYKSSEIRFP